MNEFDLRVSVDVPVRFAETDAMGVVHHSAFVIWLELGRVTWLQQAGMPYAQIAASGHHFAVTGIELQFRTAARFGDTAQVTTWLVQLRSRQVSFAYEVRGASGGELFAVGRSDHICVDLEGRTARIPQAVIDRIRAGAMHATTAPSGRA